MEVRGPSAPFKPVLKLIGESCHIEELIAVFREAVWAIPRARVARFLQKVNARNGPAQGMHNPCTTYAQAFREVQGVNGACGAGVCGVEVQVFLDAL